MGQSKSANRRPTGQDAPSIPTAANAPQNGASLASDREGPLPDEMSWDALAECERMGDPLTTHVWRYNSKTVVKRASSQVSSAAEVAALRLVRDKTSVPVPRVLKTISAGRAGPDGGCDENAWILTEYIEGEPLDRAWDSCSADQRRAILGQLRDHLDELRQLRADFVGAVGRTACHDQIFLNCGGSGDGDGTFGPYDDEDAFRAGIASALRRCDAHPAFTEMVVGLVSAMPKSPPPPPMLPVQGDDEQSQRARQQQQHPFVLTHGDLVPRNILVRDGQVVAILDWEMAGFYPAYWEYSKAHFFADYEHPWMGERALDQVLDPYPIQMGLLLHTLKVFYF